jgi:putative lipoprotein
MTGMGRTRTVSGEVVLPAAEPVAESADLVVQVEDISRADAPSTVLGEFRRRKVKLRAGAAYPFSVSISADRVDERNLYSVRAHVDVSGTGSVKRGDFVSTQTYPVLTRSHGDKVRVSVRRV